MSTMLISLGLAEFKPPSQKQIEHRERLKEVNQFRKNDAMSRLKAALKDRVMSTRDIAFFMGIERASAARYLAEKRKEGIVEVVGETIHSGDTCTQYVWRFK